MQLRQYGKRNHIQSSWLIAKEERLAVQHFAQHLQIVLAELLNLLGAVYANAVSLQFFRTLEPLFMKNHHIANYIYVGVEFMYKP